MGHERVKTELFCLACGCEAVHEVEYNGKVITRISCENCGKIIRSNYKLHISRIPGNLNHKTTVTAKEVLIKKKYFEKITNIDMLPYDRTLCLYSKLILARVITKPARLSREMHKDVTRFICSMPLRVLTKPIRLAQEFYGLSARDKKY